MFKNPNDEIKMKITVIYLITVRITIIKIKRVTNAVKDIKNGNPYSLLIGI